MDGGLNMAEELRSVLRWEARRMGCVSVGVMNQVIARLDACYAEQDKRRENCSICNGSGRVSDGYEESPCRHCEEPFA